MPAEFVGIEAIKRNLQRYDFDGLAVFRGKEEPYRRYAEEGEGAQELTEAFEEWATDMLNSNPNNYQNYKIQLYEYPEGAKKRKGTVAFTFQLVPTPESNPFKRSDSAVVGGDMVHKDTMLLAIENERLKSQLDLLASRLSELENEEEEEEEEEPAQNSLIGKVEETVINKLPDLIDLAIGMLVKNQMKQPVALGSSIDEIINEFRQLNPDIESDLYKLLQLAKTKPELFKMLITQLRNM